MTTSQSLLQTRWIACMTAERAYWFHDGSEKRPYAQLTGGKISNFYADCTRIVSQPKLCTQAAHDLLELAPKEVGMKRAEMVGFCGSAYGAITLAYDLTRLAVLPQAWYTVKGAARGEMALDRFSFDRNHGYVGLVEDVITEFTTTRGTIAAIQAKGDGEILPYVFCIVNRSGKSEIDGYKIISLIREDRAQNWLRGENPFTPNRQELVEPVRPKQHWDQLIRSY